MSETSRAYAMAQFVEAERRRAKMLTRERLIEVLTKLLRTPKPSAMVSKEGMLTCEYCGYEIDQGKFEDPALHAREPADPCPYAEGIKTLAALGKLVCGLVDFSKPSGIPTRLTAYKIQIRSHTHDPYGWDIVDPVGQRESFLVAARYAAIAIGVIQEHECNRRRRDGQRFWTVETVEELGACLIDSRSADNRH